MIIFGGIAFYSHGVIIRVIYGNLSFTFRQPKLIFEQPKTCWNYCSLTTLIHSFTPPLRSFPRTPPPPLLCLISSFPFAMPCRVFYSLVICSFHLQLQFPVQIPRYLYTICVLFVDALRQTNAATLQLMSVCSVLEKVHAKTYNERFL